MSKKIVYNNCYGGFSLSTEAVLLGRKLSNNPKWGDFTLVGETYPDGSFRKDPYPESNLFNNSHHTDINRDDPTLVAVVEQLGDKANGSCAWLKIATVNNKWRIDEYDGNETVQEPDDITWND